MPRPQRVSPTYSGLVAKFLPDPVLHMAASQTPLCPVPPRPGAGKAAIDANIAAARRQAADNRNNPAAIDYLANLEDESFEVVDPKSQNYKKNPKYPGSAPYGNFNFGATMQARGFSSQEALRYSNAFQRLTTGRPDPREDIADVTNGYRYAQNGCNRP